MSAKTNGYLAKLFIMNLIENVFGQALLMDLTICFGISANLIYSCDCNPVPIRK